MTWNKTSRSESRTRDEPSYDTRLRRAIERHLEVYREQNPLRTADVHPEDCGCQRCSVELLDAALDYLPPDPETIDPEGFS